MASRLLGCVLTGVLVAACVAESNGTTTSTDPEEDTVTTVDTAPTTTTTATQESRWIEVSGDQFIDTRTGDTFVPRGVNLLLKLGGGGGDRLFSDFDPDWLEQQLTGIAALGFNTVRFFLDMCMECTSSDSGIRSDYLDTLAHVLARLEHHGLVAMPTSNDVPDPGYSDRLPCCEPFGGYRNSLYLSPQGHQIAVEYWTDLIEGLQERGAPTHHLLGWQLANEQFILRNVNPIILSGGEVTTADGLSYDMSDDQAVEDMVVNNLRSYITTVGDAIRALDPGALITMGFFSAEDPEAGRIAGDVRWVVPQHILSESTLDFVDLHAYPGLGATWPGIGNSFGLTGDPHGFPVILGEFGAFEQAHPDPREAAAAMARWQSGSCEFGFGGWLLWFWGSDTDDEVITADADGAAVARAVSPQTRPDPCDVGPYQSDNLALERPATASAEESPAYDAAKAVDGSAATWWSAADAAPQWIEIDLGEDRTVSRVEILIGFVSPDGPQTHEVRVRGAGEPGPGRLVGEISADAEKNEWLVVEFEPVDGVRVVRVDTTRINDWVILHEIGVFAG